ncbi:MAG: WecB/TagA/CpsF family glycosyltransferase [Armatimonadetes bacterium]|nr:WecB/TagA/CpsF family glycosyltransferase [Armatimonadota bacterium]
MREEEIQKLGPSGKLLGTQVDAVTFPDVIQRVSYWVNNKVPAGIIAANVHVVMEGVDHPDYQKLVNETELVTPDGMPLVWFLRRRGFRQQTRITGPDLMLLLVQEAARQGWRVGLYGSSPETLANLVRNLEERYPGISLPYVFSPPFRPATDEELETFHSELKNNDIQLLFVSLGCPKQERFIHEQKAKSTCVMAAVGAAFPFHAGTLRKAPKAMQQLGLEWFFRFLVEPRRLWKRYLTTVPRFIWLYARQEFFSKSKN